MFTSLATVWLLMVHIISIQSFERDEGSVSIASGNVTRSIRGYDVTLACLGNFQERTPVWLKDDRPLAVAYTGNDTKNNHTRSLTIENVDLTDSGYYTCQTSAGNATTLLVVDILPSVRVYKHSSSIGGNGQRVLKCIVDGLPKPMSWWKVVTEYGEKKLKSYRENNRTLIVSARENGLYVCLASNRAGSARAVIEISPSPLIELTHPIRTDQVSSLFVPVTQTTEEEGSSGPSVVLILLVLGCVVVVMFLAFVIHTLARNYCPTNRMKSDESPCGSGLMFMKGNLRRSNGILGLSPKPAQSQEKDVAHSKSLEETGDDMGQGKSSRDKYLNRQSLQQSKAIQGRQETAV
ncbi:hemicentin-1-like isoform X2 [Corticium candelabrum]|uniref:hemicentin-1-like isoform X2 n=1 Tax=Corticium candelabrum TaxID=121492 RepID=UPI002E380926|nr:hemicentin-1-like isoform X2 [Corticium candelabrum]